MSSNKTRKQLTSARGKVIGKKAKRPPGHNDRREALMPAVPPLVVCKVVDGFVVYGTPIEPKHITCEQIAKAVASTD